MKSLGFQICCPFSVIFQLLLIAMLRTIQFNYQFCLVAIEINNIITDNILSAEAEFHAAKAFIPKE